MCLNIEIGTYGERRTSAQTSDESESQKLPSVLRKTAPKIPCCQLDIRKQLLNGNAEDIPRNTALLAIMTRDRPNTSHRGARIRGPKAI